MSEEIETFQHENGSQRTTVLKPDRRPTNDMAKRCESTSYTVVQHQVSLWRRSAVKFLLWLDRKI